MATNLKIGDCVILNSIPDVIMTVEDTSSDPSIDCIWLDNKNQQLRGEFIEGTLTKVTCPDKKKPLGMFVG